MQVNSVSAYLLRRALVSAGLAVPDLQVINAAERHRAAFLRRDVDAVVTAEPVRTEILSLGGVELFSSASLPLELVGVTIIRGAYLEQHGDRVSVLCSAWRQAEAQVRTSPEARAWVAAHMRVTTDTLNGMLGMVRLVKPSESDALLGPPRPRLMTTAAQIQSVLLEAGLMAQPLTRPAFQVADRRRTVGVPRLSSGYLQAESRSQLAPLQIAGAADALRVGGGRDALYRGASSAGGSLRTGVPKDGCCARPTSRAGPNARPSAASSRPASVSSASWASSKRCKRRYSSRRRTVCY